MPGDRGDPSFDNEYVQKDFVLDGLDPALVPRHFPGIAISYTAHVSTP